MSSEIFIIGLNEIGLSINLALKAVEANLACTGYDRDSSLARAARKRGDIERIVFTPKKSAQSADLIILAVPPIEVAGHLETLTPLMKPDAILADMSSLKATSYQWALESFPENRYYLGAVPVLNPDLLDIPANEPLLPRPDLFKGGIFALTIPPNTPEKVINILLGIINTLEAEPFFIDPLELDASMAIVEGLPMLSGLAIMRVALNSPSRREIQRFIGRTWTTATYLGVKLSSKELAGTLILNKDNMVHRLNALMDELEMMRALIDEEDEETLAAHLEEPGSSYGAWIGRRKQGNWEVADEKPLEIPKVGIMDRLFGSRDYDRKRDK
jgi:prephenate dehydrogenase